MQQIKKAILSIANEREREYSKIQRLINAQFNKKSNACTRIRTVQWNRTSVQWPVGITGEKIRPNWIDARVIDEKPQRKREGETVADGQNADM